MDAYSNDRANFSYSDSPPVLVAASDRSAFDRAVATVAGFGLRSAGSSSLSDAVPRLAQQAAASAIWVELDARSDEKIPDELVEQLNSCVRAGRQGAIVAAPIAHMDALAAVLDDGVELLVDPSEAERVAALATVMARRQDRLRVGDVAADRNAERLRQLSDEVSRIASTLARLSTGPSAPEKPVFQPPSNDCPAISADLVRSVIRARRLRARYFAEDLFADPAWDMLLDLLQAEIAHLRVPVSSLCIAAAVPATTALRWLKTLVQQGLFIRRADPHDGRRVFVELAPDTSKALRSYFAELGTAAVV